MRLGYLGLGALLIVVGCGGESSSGSAFDAGAGGGTGGITSGGSGGVLSGGAPNGGAPNGGAPNGGAPNGGGGSAGCPPFAVGSSLGVYLVSISTKLKPSLPVLFRADIHVVDVGGPTFML